MYVWKGYDVLVFDGYKHHRVNHSKRYSNSKGTHINGIENFWGYSKQRLAKFHGVSRKTFYLHLKECEFRYNHKSDILKVLRRIMRKVLVQGHTQNITDRTNWDPQHPNATLWQTIDTGLAFTVISSTANKDTQWWGTGTTKDDPNNKYAGFPQTAQTIVNYTQYNQNATITAVAYKLDIPTTQQAGIYDGTVTYQATVNPQNKQSPFSKGRSPKGRGIFGSSNLFYL